MNGITNTEKLPVKQITDKARTGELEYHLYPANEVIYNQLLREESDNPEYFAGEKNHTPDEKAAVVSETDTANRFSRNELDIPGSEQNDRQEKYGSEDVKNNYNSAGGDKHTNL